MFIEHEVFLLRIIDSKEGRKLKTWKGIEIRKNSLKGFKDFFLLSIRDLLPSEMQNKAGKSRLVLKFIFSNSDGRSGFDTVSYRLS